MGGAGPLRLFSEVVDEGCACWGLFPCVSAPGWCDELVFDQPVGDESWCVVECAGGFGELSELVFYASGHDSLVVVRVFFMALREVCGVVEGVVIFQVKIVFVVEHVGFQGLWLVPVRLIGQWRGWVIG